MLQDLALVSKVEALSLEVTSLHKLHFLEAKLNNNNQQVDPYLDSNHNKTHYLEDNRINLQVEAYLAPIKLHH